MLSLTQMVIALKYLLLLFAFSVIHTQTVHYAPPSIICNGVYQDDPRVCSGFGICVSNGTCICETGVSGNNCQIYSCFGEASNSTTACSGQGICVGPNLCSCFSGFNGTTCQSVVALTCPFATVDQQSVRDPPSLNPLLTYFENDTLYIAVDSPIVSGRLETNISIQNSNLDACNYPGPNWQNVLINDFPCFNRFQASIPWSIAKFCGWDITKNTNTTGQSQIVFSGKILVSQREDLGNVGTRPVYRVVQNAIGITVTFQTSIVLSTSVNVFDVPPGVPLSFLDDGLHQESQYQYPSEREKEREPPRRVNKPFFAAITRQEYISGPPRRAFFGLVTKIGYPYRLTNPLLETLPIGLSSTGIQEVTPPGECSPYSDFCIQEWNIPVDILTACTLTGTYRIRFTRDCSSASRDPCYPEPLFVDLNVNSEDFCTAVQIDIGVNATIISSPEATFINGPVLASNRDGYFSILVQSAQAQIMDVVPQRIHFSTDRNSYVVVDNGAVTPYGNSVGFSYLPSKKSYEKPFKCKLKKSDLGKKFVISTQFDIKYGHMVRKLTIDSLQNTLDEVEHLDKGEGKVQHRADKYITLVDGPCCQHNSAITFGLSVFTFLVYFLI